MTLCFSILLPLLFLLSSAKNEVTVKIHDNKVIATVNESFHGVAFDASLFSPKGLWSFVNITAPKLVTLLKGLSPGYFRVGGTFANWLFFDQTSDEWKDYWAFKNEKKEYENKTRGWLFRAPNILSKETFDKLVHLTKNSNMRMLFDLNAEVRKGFELGKYDSKWDSSEAEKLFKYCKEKGYGDNIDWELGNEPNHISAHNLTEKQVGEDFKALHKLLKESYPELSKGSLVGPDVGWMGVSYIKGLAQEAGNDATAFTIHQYYFNGNTSNVSTYLNVSYFEKLQLLFNKVKKELEGTGHVDKPIWLGETSSGYNSGTKDVSDRYVSGFLESFFKSTSRTLDKLGLSAVNNVKVVIRQTIYNGYYGLLDKHTLDPNPDYWLMYVHNSLVGNKVFKVDINDNSNKTRVYAQCTKANSNYTEKKYLAGALTIFALNVGDADITLKLTENYENKKIDSYVLTPPENNLTSQKVLLNGEELKLNSDVLPKLKAVENGNTIQLKSQTFGFFVIPDAQVNVCSPTA